MSGTARRTLERDLAMLLKAGALKSVGQGNSRVYRLAKNKIR